MNQLSLWTSRIRFAVRWLAFVWPSRCGHLPALALLLASAGAVGAAHALDVTVEGGMLSADLANAPIADVLAAVAEQTGARLTIRGVLGNTAREAFKSVPLAQALPRLARPNGLILEFTPGDHEGGSRRLVAIRAVAPGVAGGTSTDGASSSPRVTPLVSRQDPRRGIKSDFWDYDSDASSLPAAEERIARLGKITQKRGPAAVAALSYVLASDPDVQVRRAALGLLGGIANNDARLILAQSAADADPEVRADALRALSRAGGEKPVSLLAQAAKGDPDLRVRMTGLQLLSARDGDVARAVLQGAMSDPDPQVREAAQQALRR